MLAHYTTNRLKVSHFGLQVHYRTLKNAYYIGMNINFGCNLGLFPLLACGVGLYVLGVRYF